MSKHRKGSTSSPSWLIPVVLVAAVLILAVMVLPVFFQSPASGEASPEQIALGRSVYDANCAACHGSEGQGENPAAPLEASASGVLPAPPHDETGHTWHHPDSQLIQIIKQGSHRQPTKPMPAYSSVLTDAEIEAVLAYIKTFWGQRERQFQAEVSAKNP